MNASGGSKPFVVILAGGRGERFWPVSRERRPKQLIRLLGSQSFLQQTVDRVRPIAPLEHILVITNRAQASRVRGQLPGLPKENVIAEPCGRDTCAAVTLAAALVGHRSKAAVMVLLPADHVIPEKRRFQRVLRDTLAMARTRRVIVTIGIKPTEPATGYGYIRLGPRIETPSKPSSCRTDFFEAEAFVEKPDRETASGYLAAGRYRWNAGMFIWSYATIAGALAAHRPAMSSARQRWQEAAGNPIRLRRALKEDYPVLPKISIDYALMERAKNVMVADGDFAWDDVGAWPALARHLQADRDGNCAVADFAQVDSKDNLVFDARTKRRTLVGLVGMKNAVVVMTDDATLVASKAEAQKIKELVRKLARDPARRKLVS